MPVYCTDQGPAYTPIEIREHFLIYFTKRRKEKKHWKDCLLKYGTGERGSLLDVVKLLIDFYQVSGSFDKSPFKQLQDQCDFHHFYLCHFWKQKTLIRDPKETPARNLKYSGYLLEHWFGLTVLWQLLK